jgi:acetolactate synthase-1/2/3 large subunit
MSTAIRVRSTTASRVARARSAISQADGREFPDRDRWLAEIAALRRAWPDTAELRDVQGINPNQLMHLLAGPAAAYVTDVGQHQMWAAQSLELSEGQRFITSGGMGAMGSGLPLAIGAALANPGRPIVLIAGDGGFQLNIQELQTVVRNSLPLKIVVLNNRSHGMVRQFQETYFDQRYVSTLWGYSAPSFVAVAEAYGVAGRAAQSAEDLGEAIEWLWADPKQPALLEVPIDQRANVYPKIAFGRPLTEMEPLVSPVALEGG